MLITMLEQFSIALCLFSCLISYRTSVRQPARLSNMWRSILEKNAALHDASRKKIHNDVRGMLAGQTVSLKLAEKLADRAFSLASSANVGIVALSRSLQTRPKKYKKEEILADEAATKKVGDVFGASMGEWLKPVMSAEEIDVFEAAQQHYAKHSNGEFTE